MSTETAAMMNVAQFMGHANYIGYDTLRGVADECAASTNDTAQTSWFGKTKEQWDRDALYDSVVRNYRLYSLGSDRQVFYSEAWTAAKAEAVPLVAAAIAKHKVRWINAAIILGWALAIPAVVALVVSVWRICAVLVVA